jgi:hypothetical protein
MRTHLPADVVAARAELRDVDGYLRDIAGALDELREAQEAPPLTEATMAELSDVLAAAETTAAGMRRQGRRRRRTWLAPGASSRRRASAPPPRRVPT